MFKPQFRLRSQLLIDPSVQWPILQRTALYTASCAVYFMVVLFYAESSKIGHESPWKSLHHCFDVIVCWAPGLTMLAPIIAYDLLIYTNRFTGPMFRLRREMRRLIDDESEHPVKLRDNDHCMEMADMFNELREEILELRAARPQVAKSLFGAASSASLDPTSTVLENTGIGNESADSSEVENSDTEQTDAKGSDESQADRPDQSATDPKASTGSQGELTAEDFQMLPSQPPDEETGEEPQAAESKQAEPQVAAEQVETEQVDQKQVEAELAATQ
jgi:hypothetical protein